MHMVVNFQHPQNLLAYMAFTTSLDEVLRQPLAQPDVGVGLYEGFDDSFQGSRPHSRCHKEAYGDAQDRILLWRGRLVLRLTYV